MSKNLLIVESPAKARTLNKYLGKDFTVLASYGHVRDLIPKEGAVDPDHDFAMKYEPIARNEKHVDAIVKAFRKAEVLYLATDPDREGEAISWHISEMIKNKRGLKDKPIYRVAFNEITKSAIKDAIANPRELSTPMVNAQQARRALDYLVGFKLSPLLWKKIRRGLSAGRVQSPALRLIVERELEIEKFEPKEYWSIEANAEYEEQEFTGKLWQLNGEKLKQFTLTSEQQAHDARDRLLNAADGKLIVEKIEKKQRKRSPAAPFITSTLQQEASRKLGFTAQRTMRVAQQLYEGVEIDGEAVGLITYMRTDSVNLSQDAIAELREHIAHKYGKDQIPDEPRQFKTSAKNAQEAHEAIRPTSCTRDPEEIKAQLESDQYKLYRLIYKRTVASQMINATINTMTVDLSCGDMGIFRVTGSTIADPGFVAVYQEGEDDKKTDDGDGNMLPPFVEKAITALKTIEAKQHFTEPPPRFTEASLVKSLEEHGIGRPSTYASIIHTLKQREYVEVDRKRFVPTDIGRVVNRFLTEYFFDYVDYEFTAKLEDSLDAVSRGEKEWVPLMHDFWAPFIKKITHTEENVKRSDVTQEKLDEDCPKCGKTLAIRLGKRGRFVGCTAYPDCDYTRNMNGEENTGPEVVEGRGCPECGKELQIKMGKYGKFIGCSGYPDCKHLEPLEKPADTGVECPECYKGTILKRRSRRGKVFYSCSKYPDCSYAIWNLPVRRPCPTCGWPITTIKTTKSRGTERVCPQKTCRFSEPSEMPEGHEEE